jgi:hypothetical protein
MIVQYDNIDTGPLRGSEQLIEIIALGIGPVYASSRNQCLEEASAKLIYPALPSAV